MELTVYYLHFVSTSMQQPILAVAGSCGAVHYWQDRQLLQHSGSDIHRSVSAEHVSADDFQPYPLTLMFLAVVLLIFTLPKVYELRKHEIDSVANQVVNQSKQAYSQYGAPYVNKIPRASTSTTSNVNRPGFDSSTADSASIAPNGPNEIGYKKTY